MKIFSRKKKNNSEHRSTILAKGIHSGYKRIQEGWASWMMKCTKNFSRRTWLAILILFVLSTSTFCVYLAISSFGRNENSSILIVRIKKPIHIHETGKTFPEDLKVSEAEYDRIKKFRVYMDSLARSPAGKILYDSIISNRPGLMDSVAFLENYYEQLK
jgi:hypothetical protein